MGNIKAIKVYFSTEDNPVSFDELKALSSEDKAELGPLCRTELEDESPDEN